MTRLAEKLQAALGTGYRIDQELQGGGMSRLYLATQVELNRQVVVKVLPPELTSATSQARFKREIEITVKLQHPNIIPILTAGAFGDLLYYISLFIAGESLRERLARDGKLPLDEVQRILREAGGAVAYAHARGVVHRDIKPGNILMHEGHAVLADFGIARALVATGAEPHLTATGFQPGTPAYMPPEMPTSEQADIYALGVVGYEMLTGELPPRAVTAKDIIEKRGKVAGDSPALLRQLATAITSALEIMPEERFSTTQEFTTALAVPSRSSRASWIVAAALGVVAAGAIVLAVRGRVAASGDTRNPWMVLPFHAAAGGDTLGRRVSGRVADAFAEWREDSLISAEQAREALSRAPSDFMRLSDALAAAQAARANTLVWGDIERAGDSLIVRATSYDVRSRTALRSSRAVFPPADDTAATTAVRRLVNGLLRDGTELPWTGAGDHRRPSLAGWRAYDAGRQALARWQLPAAEQAFRQALAADADNPRADLALATTLFWRDRPNADQDLRGAARRAFEKRGGLEARDGRLAEATWLMVSDQAFEACRVFRAMVAADSTDLAGWIGLGDCQRRDPLVVRDARTYSGFAYRSSWEAAARAYRHAGDVAPTTTDPEFRGWLFERQSKALISRTNLLRPGYALTPDSVPMLAFPYLSGDTVAFAPRARSTFGSPGPDPPAERREAVVARNLEQLRSIAEQWVLRAPKSARAYAALTDLAERTGGFARVGEANLGALDVVREARRLSPGPAEDLLLAVTETRLLIKAGQFAQARVTGDSLLRAVPLMPGDSLLAGVALALGRPSECDRRLQHLAGYSAIGFRNALVRPPDWIARPSVALLCYASAGGPDDSIRVAAAAVSRGIASYYQGDSAAQNARAGLLGVALSLAFPRFPELRAGVPSLDRLGAAQDALAAGDSGAARRALAELHQASLQQRPALSPDFPFRRATLALALRDTATAVVELDRLLDGLPMVGTSLFDQPAQAGALVRSMALRAELAAAAHDRANAQKWAGAVAELWANADSGLQPVVKHVSTFR